jgi:ATP-binding cassette subfamily B (MDR/TAP) protein 1
MYCHWSMWCSPDLSSLKHLRYYPVLDCDDSLDPPVPAFPMFESCQEYWDDAADYMKDLSFKVFYGILGTMVAAMFGNILMFYGFGTASERMNRRIRNAAFQSLIRQEVAWFDVRPISKITSRLSDDAGKSPFHQLCPKRVVSVRRTYSLLFCQF